MSVREKVDHRELNIQNRMGRCVHFTGLMGPGLSANACCAAGVRYDDVKVRHEPKPYTDRHGHEYTSRMSLPCLGGSHNLVGATCEKRHTMTREEAEAEQRQREKWIADMGTARKAIIEHVKATGHSADTITCPVCTTGALGYSRASSNGHIWARCSTEGCVAWME